MISLLFLPCDDLYIGLICLHLEFFLLSIHEVMLLIRVQRFTLLSNLLDILWGFGFLHLQALELVIFKKIGHAVLEEDHPLDQSLYIKLLHYFFLAFCNESSVGPVRFHSNARKKMVEIILSEGKDVHAQACYIDLVVLGLEDADGHANLKCKIVIYLQDEQRRRNGADQSSYERKHCRYLLHRPYIGIASRRFD